MKAPNNFVVDEIEWFEEELYKPRRFKVLYGGRGGGKSTAMAKALLHISCTRKCVIVCGREYHNSLADSVYILLSQLIRDSEYYSSVFTIQKSEIFNTHSDSVFKFKGLGDKIDSIRSVQGITHFWIEEGQMISAYSWRVLLPTVRQSGSEIWVTMNPMNKTDILYKEFVLGKEHYGDDLYIQKVSWRDNRYLSNESLKDMLRCKKKDYDFYLNDWEGECIKHSVAQIFKHNTHWIEEEFEEPEKVHLYFGLDFGFSQDPTAGIRCYIHDNRLYITHEAVKLGLEIDDTGKFLEQRLPDLKKHYIYADNARPESISFIRRQGYRVEPVKKGKGSVEDGIEYIKSFDQIIINPRCTETIKEFTQYSYKVDERSGEITNDIIDANNHCIDALRYALRERASGVSAFDLYAQINSEVAEELNNYAVRRVPFPSEIRSCRNRYW